MKRAILIMLLALLALGCAESTKVQYVPEPGAVPDDPALVGSWLRSGRYFTFYADGYYQYCEESDDTVIDYGWYTAESGTLTLESAQTSSVSVYDPYWIVEDYNGNVGQTAVAMTIVSTGTVIYWVEHHM